MQLRGLFDTMQLKAAWKPMLYIFSYNMLQIPNAAWNTFQVDGLNFSDFEMGMMRVMAALATLAGLLTYKYFWAETSWRWNYVFTSLIGMVFSCLSLVLVTRQTHYLGMGDFAFAAAIKCSFSFGMGVQFMPSVLIALSLCPKHQEAAAFAVFTTFSNLGQSLGDSFGNGFIRIWDCNNDTIKAHRYDGLEKLQVLVSFISILPILWVFMLPHGRDDLVLLKGSHFWYGVAFATLYFCALSGVVSDSIYEISN